MKAGKIQINNTQTSTGNVACSVRYKPIDPGAYVSALSVGILTTFMGCEICSIIERVYEI